MQTPTTFEAMAEQYVRLRDTIKEADRVHAEKLAPAKEYMDKLEAAMLDKLQTTGQDSAKTKAGTIYRSTRKSATIADGAAFREFVINDQEFDLVDWRANANAVAEWIDNTGNGQSPPGVNYSTMVTVGVRRPTGK